MGIVRVRAAREADVAAIELLVRAAFDADGRAAEPVPVDYATLVSALGVRVAVTDDAVAGVLVLWPHPDHVLIETVAVLPAAQGAGVGTSLMAAAEREALAAGIGELRLAPNGAMRQRLAWFVRRGWIEVPGEHSVDRGYLAKRVA